MNHSTKILITGATSAIGAALAEEYATLGCELLLQGRNSERLQAVAAQCRAKGASVETKLLDLTDRPALAAWLEELESDCPDLLIANAGININTGHDGKGEVWTEVENLLELNIRSTLAVIHHLLPAMKQRGSGQLAILSSLAAWQGLPATPSYCASKAALKVYGEALRLGLADQGIRVSVVMPGYVDSAMCRAMPGPKPFLWKPEQAARVIRKGLARNQARISFPFPLNLGCWLLALIHPELSAGLLRRMGYAR